jgi:osmotically-inducible protein OsmY
MSNRPPPKQPQQPLESGIHEVEPRDQSRNNDNVDRDSGSQSTSEQKGDQKEADADAQIEEQARDRLSRQSGVHITHLEVRVNAGDVLLSGAAPSHEAKRAAQDAVEGIDGVRNVDNQIEVEIPQRAHEEQEEVGPVREL